MSSPSRTKKPRSRKSKRAPARTAVVHPRSVIPRTAPNHMDVVLTYSETVLVYNNAQTRASKTWQINDPYDIDPSFGNAYPVGFIEWAAMYKFYRVYACEIKATISNRESFPVVVSCLPSNLDISSSIASLDLQVGNPHSKSLHLSSINGGKSTVKINHGRVQFDKFIGDNYFWTDPNYAAANTTEPVNKIFYAIGAFTGGTGSYLTNGIMVTVDFRLHCRWTERINLTADSIAQRFESVKPKKA